MSTWSSLIAAPPRAPAASSAESHKPASPPGRCCEPIDLRGKEHLSELEAAHYACTSVARLRRSGPLMGLEPVQGAGMPLYRLADLQRALGALWQP